MKKQSTKEIYSQWLVLRCKEHEKSAFSELYKLWSSFYLHQIFKLTGTSQDLQDIHQEGWLAIAKNIHTLKDPAIFPAWGHKIMTHKARDWQRKNIPKERLESEGVEEYQIPIPENTRSSGAEDTDLIKKALIKLNPKQQRLIDLYYYRQLTLPDIAKQLNIPEGTVKSQLFKVRKTLKIIIERMTL